MSWLVSIFTGLSLRTWLIAAAVVFAGLVLLKTYNAGYASADAIWRAKALEARIEKLELEIKTQRDADAEEDRLRTELDSENEQLKKVIDAYVEELKTRPDKCLLGPDADRLQ